MSEITGVAISPLLEDVSCQRSIVAVTPNSKPPVQAKKVTLFCSNVQIAQAGTLWVMLGRRSAIPIYINPPAAFDGIIDIFSGESGGDYIGLDEFALSQPITGGNLVLLCVV